MDIVSLYIGQCRYEIQVQEEVPVWYTGTHCPILSNDYHQIKFFHTCKRANAAAK
jgi:hypothetical protein